MREILSVADPLRVRLGRLFTLLFVVLGPLGNLLTPQLISHAFRSYYLILITFPLFYVRCRYWQARIILFFIPFFIYTASSLFLGTHDTFEVFQEAFSRFLLLWTQFWFVLGASSIPLSYFDLKKLILYYMTSVFLSMGIGFVFYIGFLFEGLSFQFLERFSILTQIGYGFLRFAPGSYPNEYGIMASFSLSILTLLYGQSPSFFSRRIIGFLYPINATALFLTTTRAAYISYLLSLGYLWWVQRKVTSKLFSLLVCIVLVMTGLQLIGVDVMAILKQGVIYLWDSYTVSERRDLWKAAAQDFMEQYWLGGGFSHYSYLHNLYLQLLFETGIFGYIVLITGCVLTVAEKGYWVIRGSQSKEEIFVRQVSGLGLIHVLWFGVSNHNLNHHLTWFVIFILFSLHGLRYREIERMRHAEDFSPKGKLFLKLGVNCGRKELSSIPLNSWKLAGTGFHIPTRNLLWGQESERISTSLTSTSLDRLLP